MVILYKNSNFLLSSINNNDIKSIKSAIEQGFDINKNSIQTKNNEPKITNQK